MPSVSQKEILKTIEATGNLTQAAEKLYVTQPYLSKLLKDLEAKLGTPLFNRTYREMTITYAGRLYLKYLDESDKLYNRMLNDMQLIAQEEKGIIRIGISPMLSPILLPSIYLLVNEAFKHIEFKFIEHPSVELNQMLQNDEVDVILGLGKTKAKYLEDMDQTNLYSTPIYLVASDSSPLYDPQYAKVVGPAVAAKDLDHLPMVVLNQDYIFRRIIENIFETEGLSLNVMYETSNSYTAVGLVRNGSGNCLLPASVITLDAYRKCCIYPVASPNFSLDFVIYTDKNKPKPLYLQDFIRKTHLLFESQHRNNPLTTHPDKES